ncbi:cyclic nucleotide-binding domain-containing protein [Streptomyces coffeae]|uniref:Cyclic nucleotide-binding domain-containing protein n=1 Tax=Streptomyces coffeae TaxID=621382 RepID=A0ABS1NFD7_9ACTN|nr:cyclic nucleotide-binding domain-containing protein [Streptomyces coffeae]MBL1098817.1 cyclic nucleotide-binding domain-containing protein [Streptomyces coffeae]
MITRNGVVAAVPPDHRDQFVRLAHEVSFPMGTRIFEEGGLADRFWIISSGGVALDVHVPGRQAPTVDTLGPGDLLGWSWLIPPCRWHLGAEAVSLVRAEEFDAATVRALCREDPVLGSALATYVAGVVGRRLRSTRSRLLDLYGPYSAAFDG